MQSNLSGKKTYRVVEGDFRTSSDTIHVCPQCGKTVLLMHDQFGSSLCYNCKYLSDTKDFIVEVNGFVFNENDVCMNAEVIYPNMKRNYAVTFIGYVIEVACHDGENWCYAISCYGFSSPCSKDWDKKLSKDEAIKEAVEKLKVNALSSVNGETDFNNTIAMQKAARDFLEWTGRATSGNNYLVNNRKEEYNQLNLFN